MTLQLWTLAAIAVTLASAMNFQTQSQFGQSRPSDASKDFWPHGRGPVPGQYGVTDVVPPQDLAASLAWSWHDPAGQYHTTIAGGPVIDSGKNLYLTTSHEIHKFSPDGKELWQFKTPGDINNMPALMGDYVYGAAKTGHAFALHKETGEQLWMARPSTSAGPDSGYPAAYDGLFVLGSEAGTNPKQAGGNNKVVALDAYTGRQMWEFRTDVPAWNVMPLFPGDDTCIFMDFSGGVYRVGLHNGTLLWHTKPPRSEDSYTDGGVILGSNNVAYSCSNLMGQAGSEGTPGILRAFRVSDGNMIWQQDLPQPCNSWPSVGRLGDGPELSVVVTPGAFMGTPTMHGGIMAFDATTGAPQWQFQAPVYHAPFLVPPLLAAYGDYQGFVTRMLANPSQPICLPAHWSCPTIGGDGRVYAGRSDGKLYIVRSSNATRNLQLHSTFSLGIDYATTPGVEADVFDAKGASLHGAAAFAPGMMAFATCDTLYVFKF